MIKKDHYFCDLVFMANVLHNSTHIEDSDMGNDIGERKIALTLLAQNPMLHDRI